MRKGFGVALTVVGGIILSTSKCFVMHAYAPALIDIIIPTDHASGNNQQNANGYG
jgi:hypothetical protein